jgi:hypothetical protein
VSVRTVTIHAYCDECGHRHPIVLDPLVPDAQCADWYTKHSGHLGVRFEWPGRTPKDELLRRPVRNPFRGVRLARARRSVAAEPTRVVRPVGPHRLFGFLENADVKVAYAASAAPTMTLASLAASSSLLAGRESTAIDNGASVKYLDYLFAGNYRAAASNNQAGSIYTCVVGARDDAPTWPDVFDGTDSAETVSKQGIFDQVCKFLSSIAADNTASQTWYWGPASLASCFSGFVPDQFIIFVTHNIQTSANVWSATEGDHAVKYTPVYCTVV